MNLSSMNITNFKKQISSEIYLRGKDYYENGNVTDLNNLDNGHWIAEVEGNYDDYNVDINLDDHGNVKNYSCDCPYEGIICKHVVAVLLEIEENIDMLKLVSFDNPDTLMEKLHENVKASKSMNKPNETIPEWQTILNDVSDNELRDFVLNYAKHNQEFQNELVIVLSKAQKEINTEKYQKIIAHNFNKMSDRYGYIEYGDVDSAMETVDGLLEKAEDYLSEKYLHEAFSIVSAISIECINAIQIMDDSSGQCGGAIGISFDYVNRILENCTDERLNNEIFDWLYVQMQNCDYANYGCSDELETIFFDWSNNPSRLEKAYLFIDQKIKIDDKEKNWRNDYQLLKFLKYKIELLSKEGKKDEVEKIINENLHLSDFRQIKINEALAQNDYKSAIEHINKGILQAEKENHPGTSNNFKTQLLKIYTQQNDIKNIRKMAKELYFDGRYPIEYYRIFKNTFLPNEWENEREKIIFHFTSKQKNYNWGYNFQSNLADVYIEEQMWIQLLNEVKQANQINITEQYSIYLKNNYSNELMILYNNNILKYAENTGRNLYANIVHFLKNMAKLEGGKQEAKDLMHKLLEMYRNRPAMKDEFRSLNW